MEKAYEPHQYEDDIYRQWQASGAFGPAAQGDPFVIPIPPPNVTGTLHAGHAMFVTLEDILTRYNRMRGKAALWVPGTDHAAIATETVVLKNLGITDRNKQIGREEFLAEARNWTAKTHDRIITQMQKMGASCDWSREAYTFDETRELAVNTIFKMLYEKGLIYRGDRMVNWSVGAQSVLSDDEVVWEDRIDSFYSIRCGEFVIGTVRSETKAWDSPLFVNPHGDYVRVRYDYPDGSGETVIIAKNLFDDEARRKKTLNLMEPEGSRLTVLETLKGSHFVGQEFVAETYAGQRKFIVMADEEIVDMEKGTGAMTISILHSADDYELARKHDIKSYRFLKLGFDGLMTTDAGPVAGMPIEKARKEAAKIMREKGLLVGEDTHYGHRVPLCYRSNTVVEPMVSRQWFVAVDKEFEEGFANENSNAKDGTINSPLTRGAGGVKGDETQTPSNSPLTGGGKVTLKKLTADAVRGGHVKIIPERFDKTYFHWIDNLRDWCISRQIWWGHRIPVWYDEQENVYLPREQKIIFCRHSETVHNRDHVIGNEAPLTEAGKMQAEETAKALWQKGITKILASSSAGARETAEIIGRQLGIEVTDLPEFKGIDFGIVTGLPESMRGGMTSLEFAMAKQTGESPEAIYARVQSGWEKLKAMREEGTILVVAHRTVFSALDAVRAGKPPEQIITNRRQNDKREHGIWSELTLLQSPDGENLRQDEDTLDTWFSSALWPFAIFGWPEKTPDFERFYPTDVLETGYDILFFWVARMLMFGKFATGKYPFHTVYLHGLVCDAKGQKMSKSKGNGIDPLDMSQKFGTDALRLSLIMGTTPGNNVNLGEEKIAGCRNFCNKLWNISRFVLSQGELRITNYELQIESSREKTDLQSWLVAKTNRLIAEVTADLEKYRFGDAAQKLWEFSWDDFADWAVEAAKAEDSPVTRALLRQTLSDLLRLWHPFIPFVTEQIRLEMGEEAALITSRWPEPAGESPLAESFETVRDAISKIRSMRKNAGVDPTRKIRAILAGEKTAILERNAEIIKSLARLESLEITADFRPNEDGSTDMIGGITVFLPSAGMIDPAAEKARAQKELENAKTQLAGTEAKLDNPQFLAKAPEHVVNQLRAKAAELKAKIATLEGEK